MTRVFVSSLASRLRREPVALALMLVGIVLWLVQPPSPGQWLHWLHPPVMAGLIGLLAAAQAVSASGLVQRLAIVATRRPRDRRALVAMLLALSVVLGMLLTNDVALFVVVPLSLALCAQVDVSRLTLVVFEALAVNAGSALSPIGNPQNLLLWQQSGLGIPAFAWQMLGPVTIMLALLAGLLLVAFPAGRVSARGDAIAAAPLDRSLAVVAPLLLLALVILLEAGHALPGAGGVLLVLGLWRPRILLRMDWGLVLTIVLMFVVLGHLASLPAVAQAVGGIDWHDPRNVLVGGVLLSQLISNVPATVALLERVPDTMLLAAAVNIGGAGLASGSLANLIALRLEGSRRIWLVFHAWSLPYLLLVLLLAWLAR